MCRLGLVERMVDSTGLAPTNRYIQGLGGIVRVPLDGLPPADLVLAFLTR